MRQKVHSFILPVILTLCACTPSASDGAVVVTPSKQKLRTLIASSLENLDTYEKQGADTSRTLYMALGEWEHLQLRIFTRDDNPVKFRHSSSKEGIDVTLRTFADFQGYSKEVLVRAPEVLTADPDGNIDLWISFHADASVQQGTDYHETLTFESETAICSIKITVKTGTVALRETPLVPSVFGIWPSAVTDRKEMTDLLLNYRISPYFFFWEADGHSVECESSPYGRNDTRYWEYLEDKRFAAIALPAHELDDNSLARMIAEAKARSIFDKVYFYLMDEPCNMGMVEYFRAAAERVHGIDSNAKILTTFYKGPDDGPYAGKLTAMFEYLNHGPRDIYCVVYKNGSDVKSYPQFLHEDQQLWEYVTSINYPGISAYSNPFEQRAVMWRLFDDNATGFLYWAVNYFKSLNPLVCSTKHLDASLVYPGEAFGSSGLCVSTRLERWRDSQEECELLRMKEQSEGREKALSLLFPVYQGPKAVKRDLENIERFHKSLIGL